MKININIAKYISIGSLIIALILSIYSLASNIYGFRSERVVSGIEDHIYDRLEELDDYITQISESQSNEILLFDNFPQDLVIYNYKDGSLQSWYNQLPIINDEISSRLVFERLTGLKHSINSPLTKVGKELSYLNIGTRWYLIKRIEADYNTVIIAGLEIKNTVLDDMAVTDNGVNPALKLPALYSIQPLSYNGGSTVHINGEPLFKIIFNVGNATPYFENSGYRWGALLFFTLSLLAFLFGKRTYKRFFIAVGCTLIIYALALIWANQSTELSEFFSPLLYADGPLLSSLGALILTNTAISLVHLYIYLIRKSIWRSIEKQRDPSKHRNSTILLGCIIIISAISLILYTHTTLRSLIVNSNFIEDIYYQKHYFLIKTIIYLSYIGLLTCILIHLQHIRPVIKELFGIKYNILSPKALISLSLICSSYFAISTSVWEIEKEEGKLQIWAHKLANHRDFNAELLLQQVENDIANDQIIGDLTDIKNSIGIIINRISEYYLRQLREDYLVKAWIYNDNDEKGIDVLKKIEKNGIAITENSRFTYVSYDNGETAYVGSFVYLTENKHLNRVILILEPNSNKGDRGYYSILQRMGLKNEHSLGNLYSYARYTGGKLVTNKGAFPYPTEIFIGSDKFNDSDLWRFSEGGYTHFLYKNNENEYILISRESKNWMIFFIIFTYVFIILSGVLVIFSKKNHKSRFRDNYFKRRINTILFTTSLLILITITSVSLVLVYKRNEGNMQKTMSTKVITIQNLLESQISNSSNYRELLNQSFSGTLERIANTTQTDLSLFSPNGKIFISTAPELYERATNESRLNQNAFYQISVQKQRYFIQKEYINGHEYWALYAPLFNKDGDMIAIVCSPYTDINYDFEKDTAIHTTMIVNLFILLLTMSLIFTTREVNSLFEPLREMGEKMAGVDIHNLEYIKYDRHDEISPIIEAYNRMVNDLSKSTKQLAMAERDKAWSQMARQVAHEIKNPLTPIKLQLQRLIRQKENNHPDWENNFDKISAIVLEHIDILTETANEFSTFAKLYTEEPVIMDLDKILKEQIMIFDNKENITISYLGMENAVVSAPKPQLIRVFVNLITNAIQAIENLQKEEVENNSDRTPGKIMILLRNSTIDGYYDVVIDDNGPGVSEDNQHKLFTPNFTTKNGGTGLGLAICKSIIDKCNGSITYGKPFALSGASFIVTIPKYEK